MQHVIPSYMNEKTVSDITGLSLSKLRNDRSKGVGIPYCKVGRSVRYKFSDVECFMDSRRIETRNIQ